VSPFEKSFVAFRFGERSPTLLEIANAQAHAISFGCVEENVLLPSERTDERRNEFLFQFPRYSRRKRRSGVIRKIART